MNKLLVLSILSLAATAPLALAQGTGRLTYADTSKPIQWQGRLPSMSWAPDGVHLRLEGGRLLDPRSGESSAAAAAAGGDDDDATPRKGVLVHEGDLWLDEVAGGGGRGRGGRGMRGQQSGPSKAAVKLTTDGAGIGEKELAQLAPGERFASFVRGNDLYVVATADQALWRVTSDGGDERFHGKLDWVYQEEVYGRGDFRAHWWSPDGQRCAFLSLDEAPVREFTLVDHVPDGFLDEERVVHTEVANYPKSGDPNPRACMSVADAATQEVTAVDLARFPQDVLVVRVDWTPDGKTLLLTLQDRIQTWA
ncbi:MAG: DPP IV N-terminal domain-containing protein, partial [Planctomycetes bacterium]|nr:DPP IV N-terminal domain-containing protein [Planctomycetota bacterium]